MKKKDKPNWFFRILGILFLIYISLNIAMSARYYEAKLNEKNRFNILYAYIYKKCVHIYTK